MKILTNNWQLKLMALALAVVMWSHVRGEVNPWEEATFKVPLEVRPPAELVVVNEDQLPRTVKVAVRAPRLTLRQLKGVAPPNPFAPLEEAPLLKGKIIRAAVEFDVNEAGRQNAPIKATTQLDDMQIVGVNPDNIAVVLDKAAGAELSIEPELSGGRRDAYELKSVKIEPRRAQVLGLSTNVDQAALLRAHITPAELALNNPKTARVALSVVDENGVEIEGLRVEPPFAEMTATLREKQVTRRIPVAAIPTGTPAAGWRWSNIKVVPATLQVSGPRSTLDNLSKLQAPINIGGASGDLRRRAVVTLPSEVRALQTPRVLVEISFLRIAATPTTAPISSTPLSPTPQPTAASTNGGPASPPAPAP